MPKSSHPCSWKLNFLLSGSLLSRVPTLAANGTFVCQSYFSINRSDSKESSVWKVVEATWSDTKGIGIF